MARALHTLAVASMFTLATSVRAIAQEIPDERDVFDAMNFARTRPAEFAKVLEALLPYFDDNVLRLPNEIGLMTNEGASAVREAIAFLEKQTPLPPLVPSDALQHAARDHVRDQGPGGAVGHTGSDGSSMAVRIARYGEWLGTMSENIDYGSRTGERVAISLIVDDGVPSRGHRTNIFSPSSRYAGVACGPHAEYRTMCVIDYAERPMGKD